MAEQWRDIAGTGGVYQVSDLGHIRNTQTSKILQPVKFKNGRQYVTLSSGGGFQRKCTVHGLVAAAFLAVSGGVGHVARNFEEFVWSIDGLNPLLGDHLRSQILRRITCHFVVFIDQEKGYAAIVPGIRHVVEIVSSRRRRRSSWTRHSRRAIGALFTVEGPAPPPMLPSVMKNGIFGGKPLSFQT